MGNFEAPMYFGRVLPPTTDNMVWGIRGEPSGLQSFKIPIFLSNIGKAAAFVFFVFAEGCKYQRAYIFIPKIAQRILIVLVWNITIHS